MKWLAALLSFLFLYAACACAEETTLAGKIEQVIADIDLTGVADIQIDLPGKDAPVSVEEAMRSVIDGEAITVEAQIEEILKTFVRQLSGLGTLACSVLLPTMLMCLLTQTIAAGKSESAALGRHTCFLLILVPVVLCILGELEHVRSTISETTNRMDRMLPLLLTMLTALGGSASSAFLHPVVVAASGSMVYLAREVVLKLVMCTCAVTTVNHLSERAHLSRMARLLRSAVCWLLGVSFTVFLGAMSVQGVCSASIDGVAIRAAKYAVDNFVPIVGGMFSDTMDTLIGCSLIVKNALGVTAMLVLAGVIITPMLRTLAVITVLKLCAALLEPVAPGEILDAIGDFSGTLVLFLITMLCVGTMYFLLIVQMLLVGNLTVLLR